MRRRRDKRIWYVALAVFVAVFLFTFLSYKSDDTEVEAASLKDFDPGYIISDYQMGNYQSMTEAEIQAFLTAKNGCKSTDKELYDSLTARYKTVRWNFKNGHFVCLSEEVFGDGVAYGDEVTKGGETAAHIIWQAAQDYEINPQVLIVLLEKEQGLITDPYPHSGQYRAATGYGCPDTAPCAEQYYGFKNQVRKAAALFRTVLDGGWTNYPLGNNYIQYNPSASCGGSVVNVKNLATSALYRYTPYQPNAAALAAGYGTAECGAYGNRNFYLYFEDWFGGVKNIIDKKNDDAVTLESDEQHIGISDTTVYTIVSANNSSYAIDIYGGIKNARNGTNIQMYNKHGNKNQQFKFIYNKDNGFYEIVNPATNKSLNVYGGGKKEETNVQLWERDGSCASFWKVNKTENGAYIIQSSCSELVLDIYGGVAKSEKNIQIYTNHYGKNQEWILEEHI